MTMNGRDVVRGGISCPVCQADFPIVDSIAWFSRVKRTPEATGVLTAEAAQTFSGVDSPGGYVALIGSTGRLATQLLDLMPGVQLIAVCPPEGVVPGPRLSIMFVDSVIPLRRPSVRAAIIGAEAVGLGQEAGLAVLPGLRVVVENESIGIKDWTELARGGGVSVFEKQR